MRRLLLVLTVVLATSGFARADVIHLKGGGRLECEVVEERANTVVVDVSAGRVTLPRSRIERMDMGASALARFRARAARLAGADLAGWLALAAWARENDLITQSRSALEHVLALDPANAAAHQALGHVALAGRWLTVEESNRARGLVEFEGQWVTPGERQALLAERADDAARRREEMEADARIREAEARARTAEAEARRLEAEQQPVEGGIPYPFVFGGGFGPVVPVVVRPVEPPSPPAVVIRVEPRREADRRVRQATRPAASSSRGIRRGEDGTGRSSSRNR